MGPRFLKIYLQLTKLSSGVLIRVFVPKCKGLMPLMKLPSRRIISSPENDFKKVV
jgi:hypothetical protein